MRLTLVRNATLIVELGGKRVLVDPALDDAGARPPIETRRTLCPTRPCPCRCRPRTSSRESTRSSSPTAIETISTAVPRSCCRATSPSFASPRTRRLCASSGSRLAWSGDVEWGGVRIVRTPARHGSGRIAELLRARGRFSPRWSRHRRRHRLVRGRHRDDRASPAQRCRRQRRRRGIPRRRADHHGHRRRPSGGGAGAERRRRPPRGVEPRLCDTRRLTRGRAWRARPRRRRDARA